LLIKNFLRRLSEDNFDNWSTLTKIDERIYNFSDGIKNCFGHFNNYFCTGYWINNIKVLFLLNTLIKTINYLTDE